MQRDFTAIIEREGDGYVALYALSLILQVKERPLHNTVHRKF